MRIFRNVLFTIFGFLFVFALVRYMRGYEPIFFSDFLQYLSQLNVVTSFTTDAILNTITTGITNFKLTLPPWMQWLGVVADNVGFIFGFLFWLINCLYQIVFYIVYFIRFIFVA